MWHRARRALRLASGLALFALAACGPSKADFVGTWKWKMPGAEFTLEFRDNDTYRIEGSGGLGYLVGLADAVVGVPCTEGAYEVVDGQLRLRCQGTSRVKEFEFRIARAARGEVLLARHGDGPQRSVDIQLLREAP